ncbi:hypothetical protein CYMTET_37261 [Cymbomonas tetramitiformis]|uniref:Sec16 Sec23-binding domain-containing protein n=1 Tax=Cymbomonas tetramitiformis TaxID=36881 RepID=A0AAE0F6E6_9CHLO|nr:hypothetical protein CYMTET_37261 [Cymbomonas tetramitiformis]
MAPLKMIERSATVAFSPTAPYMAAGTMAGAIDLSFSSSASLEVFKMDFQNPALEMPLAGGAVPTSERFHRLVWGTTGLESQTHPLGIIAGGLVDGTVNLWNPAAIVGTDVGSDAGDANVLISKLEKHTGAVKGLDFNPFNPNLLASGAADGELSIWDLANPGAPSLYPALKSGGGAANSAGEVTCLSWNRKVQHILASTSANGTTVVWDLKRQRPVISFTDPNLKRRCSAIQWNPEVATQLIVASDDDRSPTLQVWDLRNAVSPQRELSCHTAGVLSMAWCPSDTSLLLSCAKDNRTLCWDTNSGEVVAELPPSSNWNFDVQWSVRTPGVLGASSFDGKVTLHNLQDASAPGSETPGINADFSTSTGRTPKNAMLKTPAWMKRPCGVSMGFGGRMVSHKAQEITLKNVVTNAEVVDRSAKFEQAVSSTDKGALKSYCLEKEEAAEGDDAEKDVWSFMKLLFEENARRQLLDHLGFESAEEVPEPPATPEKAPPSPAVEELVTPEKAPSPPASPAEPAPAPPAPAPAPEEVDEDSFFDKLAEEQPDDGAGFFDNLGDTPEPAPAPAAEAPAEQPVEAAAEEPAVEKAPVEEPVAVEEPTVPLSETEAEIQRALVVGNYAAAVKACLAADRYADALVLASIGGEGLWASTQKTFMERVPQPYMKVVHALVEKDLTGLVQTRPLSNWKETLAMLCTYAPCADWAGLAEMLADKLAGMKMMEAATLCYICAGSVDKAATIWANLYKASTKKVEVLQSVMEKALVLCKATNARSTSPALASLINEYAEILVTEGQLSTAMKYLCMLPGEDTPTTAALRDRIYRGGLEADGSFQPPPFPFLAHEVEGEAVPQLAPAPQTQPQQQQQQQAQQPQYAAIPQQQQQQQQQAAPAYNAAPAATAYQQQPQQTASYNQQATSFPQQQAPMQQQVAPSQFVPQAAAYHAAPAPSAYIPQQPMAQQGQQPHAPPVSGQGMFTPQQFTPNIPAQPQEQPQAQQRPGAAYNAQPAAMQPASQPTAMQPASQPTQFQPQQTTQFQPQQFMGGAQTPQYQPQPQFAPPGSQMQQAAPKAAEPVREQVPTGPPPTVSVDNVDTSAVKEELKPIVASLTQLFRSCAAGAQAGSKKRESDDNSKRLGTLFFKLNLGDISDSVSAKLLQLCAAVDRQDYATASQLQVGLTTSDWDECSQWLTALKRLIKTRQGMN